MSGTIKVPAVSVTGQIVATWNSNSNNSFSANSVAAAGASVVDVHGNTIGSGSLAFQAPSVTAVSISGNVGFNVNGDGSLSFYGPADLSLGVSGNWTNYSATVTGNVSITLTVPAAATLNGQASPPARTRSPPTPPRSPAAAIPRRRTFPAPSPSPRPIVRSTLVPLAVTSPSAAIRSTPPTAPRSPAIPAASPSRPAAATTLIRYAQRQCGQCADRVGRTNDVHDRPEYADHIPGERPYQPCRYVQPHRPGGGRLDRVHRQHRHGYGHACTGLQSGTYSIQIIAQSTTDPDFVANLVPVTITPTAPGINLT